MLRSLVGNFGKIGYFYLRLRNPGCKLLWLDFSVYLDSLSWKRSLHDRPYHSLLSLPHSVNKLFILNSKILLYGKNNLLSSNISISLSNYTSLQAFMKSWTHCILISITNVFDLFSVNEIRDLDHSYISWQTFRHCYHILFDVRRPSMLNTFMPTWGKRKLSGLFCRSDFHLRRSMVLNIFRLCLFFCNIGWFYCLNLRFLLIARFCHFGFSCCFNR